MTEIASNPKDPDLKAPTTRTVEKDGFKIAQEWDRSKGVWVEVARNKIREPADPVRAENIRSERESKAAIDKAMAEFTSARKALADAQKGGDESAIDAAKQAVEDARSAYNNRASDHKAAYGRAYNPIKEVAERNPARDIAPLEQAFAEKGGLLSRRDYPTLIKDSLNKGWTADEIRKAAKGTDGEGDVNSYFQQQPAKRELAPQQQGMNRAKPQKVASSKAPMSAAAKRLAEKY